LIFADLPPNKETPVFEEFAGIPAHPLLVHAAVVFVPLLAVLAIAYAFVPIVRPHTRWVLALLALGTPVTTLLAKLSGDAFYARLDANDRISDEYYPKLDNHQDLGNTTLVASIVLALLALALVYLVKPTSSAAAGAGGILTIVVKVLLVAAAAVSVYYVVMTGDTGAKAVWTGL
jgi:hypothetical protein